MREIPPDLGVIAVRFGPQKTIPRVTAGEALIVNRDDDCISCSLGDAIFPQPEVHVGRDAKLFFIAQIRGEESSDLYRKKNPYHLRQGLLFKVGHFRFGGVKIARPNVVLPKMHLKLGDLGHPFSQGHSDRLHHPLQVIRGFGWLKLSQKNSCPDASSKLLFESLIWWIGLPSIALSMGLQSENAI